MIGAGIGLILVGIVILFFLPWVGVPIGLVGLVLLLLYLIGFGRRAVTGRQP